MRPIAKFLARRLAALAGRELVPAGTLAEMSDKVLLGEKALLLAMVEDGRLREALDLLPHSTSQLNQDFFALSATGWKRSGFFVEFGATDGVTLSNSYLLEKHFGWRGILAEPGRVWRGRLENSGRSAAKDYDCVWSKTGETLSFCEAEWSETSTIEAFSARDHHERRAARRYDVSTVSLGDLLDRHDAPATIDYLSIDTEGSEFAILEAYDFASRPIGCITVEHNYTPDRERIHGLLTSQGYERRFEDLSQFDDWYVLVR